MIVSLALTQRTTIIFYVCFCLKTFPLTFVNQCCQNFATFSRDFTSGSSPMHIPYSVPETDEEQNVTLDYTPLLFPLLSKAIAVDRHIDCFTSAWSPIGRLDLYERPFLVMKEEVLVLQGDVS